MIVTTIVNKLKAGESPPFRPHVQEECLSNPKIKSIMDMCWTEKPDERPTVKILMAEVKYIMKYVPFKINGNVMMEEYG